MSNILITGATGFLGSSLIEEILSSSSDTVYAIVRGRNIPEGEKRLRLILEDLSEWSRIKVCMGDVTKKDLGLSKDDLGDLTDNIDIIYHTAAVTDLNLPLKKARYINVEGTKNILDLALTCKEKGVLKKVNHISTSYVAGTKRCLFKESDLDVGQGFNNTYEQSKYEAEKLIFRYREKGLDIDIFRPSIILGRFKDGKTTNFKMFYQPLHFFSLELFDRIPATKNSRANLINVDTAAKAIFSISSLMTDDDSTYHIASPEVPTFDHILDVASDFFGFKKPDFTPPEKIDIYKEYSVVKRKMIEPYIPYFNYLTEFDITNTMRQLRNEGFTFPEFDEDNLIRLFGYCDENGFIKRKKVVIG